MWCCADIAPRRLLQDRAAASAVEFALVFPLFIILLFGIIVYGTYLATIHGVQQLAAEAARSSIAGLTDSERASLAQNYVTANVSYYPFISPGRLSVSAAPSPSDDTVFVVTVSYDDSASFIFSLPSIIPMPASDIVRSAVIPRGGY